MKRFHNSNEFQNELFSNVNLENQTITSKLFFSCEFRNCNFSYTDFESTLFEECSFLNCNFSLSKIFKTQIRGVVFNSCKIMGIDFTRCDALMIDISINECNVKSCIFSGLCLKKTIFCKSDLIECDFVNTDFSETDLSRSDFSGSLFHNTNLFKANLTDCINYNIDPLRNNIKKAKFSLPEALTLLNAFEIFIQ